MKHNLLILLALFSFVVAPAQDNYRPEARKRLNRVDTSHIYELPFLEGSRHYLIQGYQTVFSHRGECALDFTMKEGTPVCAARGGIVTDIKENGTKHGLAWKFADEGNYVEIRHEDGTYAAYWHLMFEGALVEPGDTVVTGQVIGLSGHTGYSAMPHLHFEVYCFDKHGNYVTLPTRFLTDKGISYLKAPRHYKKPPVFQDEESPEFPAISAE